jgi:hypothetical protein
MGYDVKFYKTRRLATSPDDLGLDNLLDMGSGDELKQQLTPVIPDFIWGPPVYLPGGGGRHWHRAGGYPIKGNHYVFWFLAEPTNSEVRLNVMARERVGREEFVQRICDALGWAALVDRWEPPNPRTSLFFAPRATDRSSDSTSRHA